jgi:hypothetical protein
MQMGHEVIVAHARNVRLIGESSRKDDQLDARTLARLARIDPGHPDHKATQGLPENHPSDRTAPGEACSVGVQRAPGVAKSAQIRRLGFSLCVSKGRRTATRNGNTSFC